MKERSLFFVIAVGILSASTALSQQGPVAQVPPAVPAAAEPAHFSPAAAEIARLAQSSVGEDVVLAYVKNSQTPYNLSATDIVALKNAGVSEPVISAMLSHDTSLRNQAPAVNAPNPAAVPAPATVPSGPGSPETGYVTNAPLVPTGPVVEQSPPGPKPEVIPVAPGPNYYWVPGY